MPFKFNFQTGCLDVVRGTTSIGSPITSGTPGSVLFVGGTTTSPTFAQDNRGFRYDDTNNRLSIFTTLSTELLSNPNFTSNASGWTVPAGMAWSSGAVSKTGNGTGALSQTQTPSITTEYELSYTISNWTAGTVTPSWAGWTGTAVSANGTYIERFVALTTTSTLAFTPSNTARFTIDTISLKTLTGTNTLSNLNTGGLNVQGSWSNGSPGTTRHTTINNEGSYSWTDYRFQGFLRGAFGVNSSGGIDLYQSGGNGFALYAGNSGLTSNSLYMYSTSSTLTHYGYGAFSGGVHAGSVSANTSTLQSAGGSAFKVKRVTASQSLDNTATVWLADASTPVCTGTPSVTACSTYTASGQATCESHLPCTWFAGYACSAFNSESGMSTCISTSGCAADSSSCAGAGDESSCLSQDDSYGGNCSWQDDSPSCVGFDESTCGSTSGCNSNYTDCSSYTSTSACEADAGCDATLGGDCSSLSDGGGDGTNCATQPECSYDSGTGACSGNYFTSCSGTGTYTGCTGNYSSYSCHGTYYTGNCSGSYNQACQGTVLCSSYSSSGACTGEAGCTWVTAINLTLPDGETCPDRFYAIKNDSSTGADVNILPYSGQTVEKQSGGITLANYQDAVMLAYFKQTYDCSNYLTEGACTPTGCSKNYSSCSWNAMDSTCYGHASCTAPDQITCEATTYYSGCSGTQIVAKNWYIL